MLEKIVCVKFLLISKVSTQSHCFLIFFLVFLSMIQTNIVNLEGDGYGAISGQQKKKNHDS